MRSDIRGTVDLDRKRLDHFNIEKSKVALFDRLHGRSCGLITLLLLM